MQSDLHHAIKLYTHMQFLKLSHLNITTLKDKTRGPVGRIDHLKKKHPAIQNVSTSSSISNRH